MNGYVTDCENRILIFNWCINISSAASSLIGAISDGIPVLINIATSIETNNPTITQTNVPILAGTVWFTPAPTDESILNETDNLTPATTDNPIYG